MPAPEPLIIAVCSASPAGVTAQSSRQVPFSTECVQLSEKALIAGQYAGLVLLAALMGLAFYNDIVHRLLS